MYGVALGGFHPESQGRHLSFEVTGRKRDKGDKEAVRVKGEEKEETGVRQ